MSLFDHRAYHLHQDRAKASFDQHSFLFDHVSHELTARLKDFKASFSNPLILSPSPLPLKGTRISQLLEVHPIPPDNPDLILSCLQAHWMNDLLLHLKNLHNILKPEGLFICALWGGQTLFELRESLLQAEVQLTGGASPRVAPFVLSSDAPTLLSKVGFFMPVVDTEKVIVTYSSLKTLMQDLKGMGETNIMVDRCKSFTPRSLFEKTEKIYFSQFGTLDKKILATFEILYLTGWKNKNLHP